MSNVFNKYSEQVKNKNIVPRIIRVTNVCNERGGEKAVRIAEGGVKFNAHQTGLNYRADKVGGRPAAKQRRCFLKSVTTFQTAITWNLRH
jgi:hypothetical protein